jgi:hypothetical protein
MAEPASPPYTESKGWVSGKLLLVIAFGNEVGEA